jgi:protoporphyrinogen oxidase
MSKTNVVLGGGPAGLFCAHELHQKDTEYVVLEKEDYVGGLAATHQLGEGSFEVGPHIFHTDDQYILQIAQTYLGDDLMQLDWNVKQYLDKKLLTFPNSLSDMWRQLGSYKMLGFLASYLISQFDSKNDFRSFIYRKVGKSLAEFNVINYTEKMWGIPVDELETAWIKPRMDRISIWKIIQSAYKENKRTFLYPEKGSGMLYEKMAERMRVNLKEYPISIEHDKGRVQSLISNKSKYNISHLFSSIPLLELLNVLRPAPPEEVLDAAKSLQYRAQVYVALELDLPDALGAQWVYFPEHQIPFCRVHSAGAFSKAHVANEKSILIFEYFCFDEDSIFSMCDDDMVQFTLIEAQKLTFLKPGNVSNFKVLRKKYAYPLMSQKKNEPLQKIKNYIGQVKNLHMMGRHGLYTYDNQHDAARTGVDAVRYTYRLYR